MAPALTGAAFSQCEFFEATAWGRNRCANIPVVMAASC